MEKEKNNKKIVIIILIALALILAIVGIVFLFISNSDKVKIEYQNIEGKFNGEYKEYLVSDKINIKSTVNLEKNLKIMSNEKLIVESSPGNFVDKVEKLTDTEFLIKLSRTNENSTTGYYLFYESGNKYLNLGKVSKNTKVKNITVKGNKFTIESSLPYSSVDTLCYTYNEDDVIETTEKIEYYGNGEFSKSTIIKESTLLDVLKRETNYTSCKQVKNK